jgi:transcriptional regulator with XRE-family HTH domain
MDRKKPETQLDRKKLGKVIQDLRTDRDETVYWCSHESGIAAKKWERIEAGKTSITVDQLFSIAAFFYIKPAEIFKKIDDFQPRINHSGIIRDERDIPREAFFATPAQLPIHHIHGMQIKGFYTKKELDKVREFYDPKNRTKELDPCDLIQTKQDP